MSSIRFNPIGVNRRRFFSSIRTVMIVRFDPGILDNFDADDIIDNKDPDPNQLTRLKKSQGLGGKQFETGPVALSSSDYIAALTAARINLADAIANIPADGLSRILDIQPTKSSRALNSYKKADELTLTIPWKSAPFDARIIRSILLFHYEGTVPADAFASGRAEGTPNVPTASGFKVPATGDNLRFVGLVDDFGDSHDEGGDSITVKARDLTGVLIDTPVPPKVKIKIQSGDTAITAIRRFLDTNLAFERVIGGPLKRTEGDLPILDPTARYGCTAIPPKERHRAEQTKGSPSAERQPKKGDKTSYWDSITEFAAVHALRATIEGNNLILLEPRNLYKRIPEIATQPGVPTFPKPGGHRVRIGETFPTRRMVIGDNILSLRFHRKFGKIKVPTIEVVSRNCDAEDATQRLLKVRFPPVKRATRVDPAGKAPQEEIYTVHLRGIIDKSQLFEVARQVYEGMGRQEVAMVITTNDPASYSDHPDFDPNEEPDLLDLRAGDPIQILATPTERRGRRLFSLNELGALVRRNRRGPDGGASQFSDPVEFLTEQGWRREDAVQLTRILSSANLPSEFRVVSASISFDGEGGGGFSIQIDARDYIRARADPDGPALTGGLNRVLPGDVAARTA